MRISLFKLFFLMAALAQLVHSIRLVNMPKKVIARPSTFNVTMDSNFAVRFFFQLLSSSANDVTLPSTVEKSSNILFSPFSIAAVLSAVAEGANGTTAHEIHRTLSVNALSMATIRQKMAYTLNLLNKSNHHYTLSIANRMFVQSGYKVLPQFEQNLRNYYKMNAERLNFGDPNAAERHINNWVSKITNGHITSLIPSGSLDSMTRMVLTNAVYFKGEWETTFDEKMTRRRPFYVSKQRQINVPMMYVEGNFPYHYFERLGFEMVELPYAGQGEVSMFVVLPFQTHSLMTIARRLRSRPYLLCRRLKRLQAVNNMDVTVLLPKFQLQESVDLKGVLSSMGVKDLFDRSQADLSKVAGNRELHVSDAYHKASIEVSEKGTKASAASAVVIKGRSMSSDPVFRADRPFIFFIRHNPSAAILFMGAVTDFPEEQAEVEEELHDFK